MAKIINIIQEVDTVVECSKCGGQAWIVILNPSDHTHFIRLECANEDCDAFIPFED